MKKKIEEINKAINQANKTKTNRYMNLFNAEEMDQNDLPTFIQNLKDQMLCLSLHQIIYSCSYRI